MAHIGVTQGLRRVYGRVYGLGVYSQEERIKCTRQWKTRWNCVCFGDYRDNYQYDGPVPL